MSLSEQAAEAIDLCSPESPKARPTKRLKVHRKGSPRLRDMEAAAAAEEIIDLSLEGPDSAGKHAMAAAQSPAAQPQQTLQQLGRQVPLSGQQRRQLWGELFADGDDLGGSDSPVPFDQWRSARQEARRRRVSAYSSPLLQQPQPQQQQPAAPAARDMVGDKLLEDHDSDVDLQQYGPRRRFMSRNLRAARRMADDDAQPPAPAIPQPRAPAGVWRRPYDPPQFQSAGSGHDDIADLTSPLRAAQRVQQPPSPKPVHGSPRARKAAADAALARRMQAQEEELANAQAARAAAFRRQQEEHQRRAQQLAALDAAAANWADDMEDDSPEDDDDIFVGRTPRGQRSVAGFARRTTSYRGGRGGRGEQRREWGGASLADAMLGMLAEQGSWNGMHLGGMGGHHGMGGGSGLHHPFGGLAGGGRDLHGALGAMRAALTGMTAGSRLPAAMLFSDRDFDENDYEALLALDEGIENRRGASKEAIEAIPTVVLPASGAGQEEEPRCPICLEEYEAGATLRRLCCNHAFHQGCLDTWLQQKASCPICQAKAVTGGGGKR